MGEKKGDSGGWEVKISRQGEGKLGVESGKEGLNADCICRRGAL